MLYEKQNGGKNFTDTIKTEIQHNFGGKNHSFFLPCYKINVAGFSLLADIVQTPINPFFFNIYHYRTMHITLTGN